MDDIYEDVDFFPNWERDYHGLKDVNEQLTEKIIHLEAEVARLSEELASTKKIQVTLEQNISSLFKTAKLELERKNRHIEDLRKQLDTLLNKSKPNYTNRPGLRNELCNRPSSERYASHSSSQSKYDSHKRSDTREKSSERTRNSRRTERDRRISPPKRRRTPERNVTSRAKKPKTEDIKENREATKHRVVSTKEAKNDKESKLKESNTRSIPRTRTREKEIKKPIVEEKKTNNLKIWEVDLKKVSDSNLQPDIKLTSTTNNQDDFKMEAKVGKTEKKEPISSNSDKIGNKVTPHELENTMEMLQTINNALEEINNSVIKKESTPESPENQSKASSINDIIENTDIKVKENADKEKPKDIVNTSVDIKKEEIVNSEIKSVNSTNFQVKIENDKTPTDNLPVSTNSIPNPHELDANALPTEEPSSKCLNGTTIKTITSTAIEKEKSSDHNDINQVTSTTGEIISNDENSLQTTTISNGDGLKTLANSSPMSIFKVAPSSRGKPRPKRRIGCIKMVD